MRNSRTRIPILHGFRIRFASMRSSRRIERLLLAPAKRTIYIPSPGRRNLVAGRQVLPNAMLNEVYNSRIPELAGNIPRLGRAERRDATATAHSSFAARP